MARLKLIDRFDSQFSIAPDAKAALFALLTNATFLGQVCSAADCDRVEFTTLLFQPVPYTTAEPKGMPAEFEQYHNSPDYLIVNVPPNFMFQAKIFQPNRLCAIYRLFR
ncbi:MAG: hypothetical protein HC895_14360 [Leptolyngbyaceae cyanobacterium SM1_3_5]|nr:hypothetical protein [Leptolyngbyaceae cyanobacterium SM1_3_5]